MIKDASRALCPDDMTNFLTSIKDDSIIDIIVESNSNSELIPVQKDKLIDFFKDPTIHSTIKNDDSITFSCEEEVLIFIGLDYLWWSKTSTKLNKLFSMTTEKKEKSEQKAKKSDIQIKVAMSAWKDDELLELLTFEGSNKEAIDFINLNYNKLEVRHFNDCVVKICINYASDEELYDLTKWYTLQELITKGVFIS